MAEIPVSLLCGAALAAADLAVLALFTRRLGASSAGPSTGGLALMLALKLALLAAGAAWLSRRAWIDRTALAAGLIFPFAGFLGWQAWGLILRARRA